MVFDVLNNFSIFDDLKARVFSISLDFIQFAIKLSLKFLVLEFLQPRYRSLYWVLQDEQSCKDNDWPSQRPND